jgi:hypothetical protein
VPIDFNLRPSEVSKDGLNLSLKKAWPHRNVWGGVSFEPKNPFIIIDEEDN